MSPGVRNSLGNKEEQEEEEEEEIRIQKKGHRGLEMASAN